MREDIKRAIAAFTICPQCGGPSVKRGRILCLECQIEKEERSLEKKDVTGLPVKGKAEGPPGKRKTGPTPKEGG